MKKEIGKLEWQEPLFKSESIENYKKIKKKLDSGKIAAGIYLLTLSANPDNMIELFSAYLLQQPAFRSQCQPIIGMAKGKEEAISLVQKIVEETYQATGKCNVPEYLKNR